MQNYQKVQYSLALNCLGAVALLFAFQSNNTTSTAVVRRGPFGMAVARGLRTRAVLYRWG